jgi:hypothetical protein
MNRNPKVLYKTLVVAIIVLFVGASVTPLVGSLSIQKFTTNGNAGNSDISLITIKVDGEIVNDWYVSDVGFNFTYESEDIAEIKYMIDSGDWQNYSEPFNLTDDGKDIMLEWCAVNNLGNYSEVDGPFFCSIDQTRPEISLTYEVVGGNPVQGWDFEFTAYAVDAMSGMERVEFYFNGEIQETVYGPGPEYVWCLRYWPIPQAYFGAIGYDNAGNSESDDIIGSGESSVLESSFFNINKKKIEIDSPLNERNIIVNTNENPEKSLSVGFEGEVFDPGYVIVILNKKPGKNGWIVSNVSIPIFYETDRIAVVYYKLNDEDWIEYSPPIMISDDGIYVFSWYVVDFEGHESTPEFIFLKIDQTCPEISLFRKKITVGKIKFTANVYDKTSGVDRVNFRNEYGGSSFTDFDFPYEWIWKPEDIFSLISDRITAIVYDYAGNSNSCSMSTRGNSYDFNHESGQGDLL